MLYKLLWFPSRIAIHLYCRKIIINHKEMLRQEGPLLIAANHPNSFLDAIIVATLFKAPIYSLARGDAFTGKRITKILTAFNMLPVYRVSEGVENLGNNYDTFATCQKLFEQNKIVLIFSEGRCINEWHLRPLKKGTARLALTAWQHHVPLRVLPLGINYSSFRKFGKNVVLNFGVPIHQTDLQTAHTHGHAIAGLNAALHAQLKTLVFEKVGHTPEEFRQYFHYGSDLWKRIFLLIPAALGWILHAPLYTLLHLLIRKRAKDHYDSIMTGLLFFLYPFYVLLLTLAVFFASGNFLALGLLAIMPACAYCFLHFKEEL